METPGTHDYLDINNLIVRLANDRATAQLAQFLADDAVARVKVSAAKVSQLLNNSSHSIEALEEVLPSLGLVRDLLSLEPDAPAERTIPNVGIFRGRRWLREIAGEGDAMDIDSVHGDGEENVEMKDADNGGEEDEEDEEGEGDEQGDEQDVRAKEHGSSTSSPPNVPPLSLAGTDIQGSGNFFD